MKKRAVIDTKKDIDDEHDFEYWMGYLRFCPICFYSGKGSLYCIKCGSETVEIRSLRARPPRQKASKMRWKEFFDVFFPKRDFDNTWRRRQAFLRGRK